MRCATESELIKQGETNKWPLEILLALTFNEQALKTIKDNSRLI